VAKPSGARIVVGPFRRQVLADLAVIAHPGVVVSLAVELPDGRDARRARGRGDSGLGGISWHAENSIQKHLKYVTRIE
jgi:hypothetical protein